VLPESLLLLVLAGLLGPPDLLSISEAEPLAGTVSVDPPSLRVARGASGIVAILSDGMSNIYGAQLALTFDASQLQVIGAQINPGSCPGPDFVVTNSVHNETGMITYAVTQLAPTTACDGGVIASVEFFCLDVPGGGSGTTPITLTESVLSDSNGMPINHTVQHGQITCVTCCMLSGVAVPQGHVDRGVQVCLDGAECVETTGYGYFASVVSSSEAHTITADVVGHLAARTTNITLEPGSPLELGLTTLRAGDLNEDGVINILELVIVGGNFSLEGQTGW
jgi:hypothetical protein